MPTLLIIHHTPSPALQAMFEAAATGARTDEIENADVVVWSALTTGAAPFRLDHGGARDGRRVPRASAA
jgi:hypothetical protein